MDSIGDSIPWNLACETFCTHDTHTHMPMAKWPYRQRLASQQFPGITIFSMGGHRYDPVTAGSQQRCKTQWKLLRAHNYRENVDIGKPKPGFEQCWKIPSDTKSRMHGSSVNEVTEVYKLNGFSVLKFCDSQIRPIFGPITSNTLSKFKNQMPWYYSMWLGNSW